MGMSEQGGSQGQGPIIDGCESFLARAHGQEQEEEGSPSEDPAAQGTMGELGKDPQLDRALELLKSWQVFKTLVAKND